MPGVLQVEVILVLLGKNLFGSDCGIQRSSAKILGQIFKFLSGKLKPTAKITLKLASRTVNKIVYR